MVTRTWARSIDEQLANATGKLTGFGGIESISKVMSIFPLRSTHPDTSKGGVYSVASEPYLKINFAEDSKMKSSTRKD